MKLINFQLFSSDSTSKNLILVKIQSFCLVLGLISGLCGQVSAQEIESIEEIRLAAKKFLEEKQVSADKTNTEISIGQIDPRMRLAKCTGEMNAFLPQTYRRNGKTTVGIRCNGPINWKIFVSARITEYQDAWVLNRNLTTGDIVTQDDIEKKRVEVTDSRKIPLTDLKHLLQASPRRAMRAGSTLYQDSVCLVCRGDRVTVSAKNQFLSINVEGVALSNAILGEKAQIRNSKSKKVFGAVVTGKNQLNIKIAGSN